MTGPPFGALRPGGLDRAVIAATSALPDNWLGLRLQEPGPNRDAIGAWIEVRAGDATQSREVTVGGGHAGGQLGWIQFGLGPATSAEVRVQWPDGEQGPWQSVTGDGHVIFDRAAGAPRPWQPPKD